MAAERQKPHPKTGDTETPDQPKDKRADYLTARQLSEVLQISEATVHRLRRAGRIPAVLLTDRLIRFNLRDVQKALRPHSASHFPDGRDADQGQEPSPQLSFEDLLNGSDET
ncbi:MAG TPA: helix-turn-helix domain-containing protein [Blastocatellia bacterium]|nr:helix-turn-helix domain-containing protein [Blastocatellia bacterium]